MSAVLYDIALTEKLKRWTEQTDIHVYSPEESNTVFALQADIHNDKPVSLPFIRISRPGGYTIINYNKKALTYDGFTLDASLEKGVQLNAIPISISYQIDVYARYLTEADEYMRNLIFNIINFPMLKIQVPYRDLKISHDSAIRIMDNKVYDNSNATGSLDPKSLARLSIAVNIDDAYIWDVRVRNNVQISDVQIETK